MISSLLLSLGQAGSIQVRKLQVHAKLSGSYINYGTFKALRDIFVSCVIPKQACPCIHQVCIVDFYMSMCTSRNIIQDNTCLKLSDREGRESDLWLWLINLISTLTVQLISFQSTKDMLQQNLHIQKAIRWKTKHRTLWILQNILASWLFMLEGLSWLVGLSWLMASKHCFRYIQVGMFSIFGMLISILVTLYCA